MTKRAAPEYAQLKRGQFAKLWRTEKYERALGILRDHPYVVERKTMAVARCYLTLRLGDYRASAAFLASAYQFGATDPQLVMDASLLPYQVLEERDEGAAWEAARITAVAFPHAATAMIATLVLAHLIRHSEQTQIRLLADNLLGYFEDARKKFAEESTEFRSHPEVRKFMELCFVAARLAALEVGDEQRAADILTDAEDFGIRSPEARGMLPNTQSSSSPLPESEESTESLPERLDWAAKARTRVERFVLVTK